MRMISSACISLALVAEGVADLFWYTNLCMWDMAAGYVLVTEAGGTVLTVHGKPFDLHGKTVLAASSVEIAKYAAQSTAFDHY